MTASIPFLAGAAGCPRPSPERRPTVLRPAGGGKRCGLTTTPRGICRSSCLPDDRPPMSTSRSWVETVRRLNKRFNYALSRLLGICLILLFIGGLFVLLYFWFKLMDPYG